MTETETNSNYPHNMKDKEIEVHIRNYSQKISNASTTNDVIENISLVQLGQNELQSRQTKRTTRLSVGVSVLSLLIAGLALYVSLVSSRTNERWETNQINTLTSLKEEISNFSNRIDGTLKEQNTKANVFIERAIADIITSIKDNGKKTTNKTLKQTD